MPFSIEDFRQHFNENNETARADKFEVIISVPPFVAGGVTNRDLALQCEASELPGRDVSMIEYRHHSFIQRIPHFNSYGLASFTFYCTGDMIEKKLFDRWFDIMVPATVGLVQYPIGADDLPVYHADIVTRQYDNRGGNVYSTRLFDAIPVSMSPIAQNWSDDSIMRLQINFAFTKWMSEQNTYNPALKDFTTFGQDKDTIFNQIGKVIGPINNYTNISSITNRVKTKAVENIRNITKKTNLPF